MGDSAKKITLLIALAAAFHSQYPISDPPSSDSGLTPLNRTSFVLLDTDERATIRLTPGTAVLLGSLDQFAHRHQVRLLWHPDTANDDGTSPHLLTSSHKVMTFPEGWETPIAAILPVPLTQTDQSPIAIECEPVDVVVQQDFELPRRRRFVVPCFCGQRVYDRNVLATEIARGRRVSVFLVDGDDAAAVATNHQPRRDVITVATEIIQRAEGRVLEYIETQIGQVTDLDEDGRLCFVLARLTTGEPANETQQPITGCVRPDDFLSELPSVDLAGAGGDIVYLDRLLPTGRELDAILAHELAHAATFCAIRQASPEDQWQLPGWLNEAIAHYLEMQINPASDNLRTRLSDFTREPHRFPLVIPDCVQQQSLRRGPTRAAACLFLSNTLQQMPQETLRTLVCCPLPGTDRLESVTGNSFSETFRAWGLSLMASPREFPRHVLRADNELKLQLAGTAFTWTAPVQRCGTLEILASSESQLQVTVVAATGTQTAAADETNRR